MKRRIIISVMLIAVLLTTSACQKKSAYSQWKTPDGNSPEIFISVPLVRQSTNYTCGVACTQSLLWYVGTDFREDLLADELGTTEENGTNAISICNFINTCDDMSAEIKQDMTVDDLKTCIKEGKPVMVLIQAWEGVEDFNYSDYWEDGHFVIAIGYDDNNLYFMDPSYCGNYTYIPIEEFVTRWHDYDEDSQYVNAGIIVTCQQGLYDPYTIWKTE